VSSNLRRNAEDHNRFQYTLTVPHRTGRRARLKVAPHDLIESFQLAPNTDHPFADLSDSKRYERLIHDLAVILANVARRRAAGNTPQEK
jgi:hypothetical protein